MEYANTLTMMVHAYIIKNKHARAQNKSRSFVNETVKMVLLDQKLRKHFVLRQHVLSAVCLARRLLSSKGRYTTNFPAFQPGISSFSHTSEHLLHNGNLQRGSDFSSCPNTTYRNLHHLHPQNHLNRQPC